MTNHEAIEVLTDVRDFALGKIAERFAKGLPAHHDTARSEALDIAIAAVTYVQQVQEYEAFQKQV